MTDKYKIITHENVVDFLISQNNDLSKVIENAAQSDYYGLLMVEIPTHIKNLINNNEDSKVKICFDVLNIVLDKSDEYLLDILFETVIESFALSGEKFYLTAKACLNDMGKNLLDERKKNPPLGFKPLNY